MHDHLTHDQLTRATIGDSTAQEVQHLGECSVCRVEVVTMNESLLGFRDAVLNWTHSQTKSAPRLAFAATPTTPRRTLRWSLAAAAVALVMTIPIYRKEVERQRLIQEAEDTRLLEQIDLQLSRVVPAPMESLVTLLPNETSTNDGESR
jgi:hypothetical protein